MEWSAEIATQKMWDGLNLLVEEDDAQAYSQQCLQDAYDAGRYVAYMDAIKMVREEIKTARVT